MEQRAWRYPRLIPVGTCATIKSVSEEGRNREEVRWLNEGRPPSPQEVEDGAPRLHAAAKGYLLCGACGHTFRPDVAPRATGGRRRARSGATHGDVYGHGEQCPQAGAPPRPVALETSSRTEVLRLLIPVPASLGERALLSWGLSLGYALRTGMRHLYMLDGPEIELELEGHGTRAGKRRDVARSPSRS